MRKTILTDKHCDVYNPFVDGIVKKNKNCYHIKINNSHFEKNYETLEDAENAFIQRLQGLGITLHPKQIVVFEHLPQEKVYKYIRIR
jgi:hypothetical protein